jgi:hypothetical protein
MTKSFVTFCNYVPSSNANLRKSKKLRNIKANINVKFCIGINTLLSRSSNVRNLFSFLRKFSNSNIYFYMKFM